MLNCADEPKNNNQQNGAAQTQSRQDDNLACSAGNFLNAIPPGNSYYEELLTRNWWVVEFYIDTQGPKDRLNRNKAGRWYKFESDGTYTDGHWEEQVGNGSWKVTQREGKTFLFVDNKCNNRDGEWELQDANNAEDAMSWNAVKGFNDDGAIIKIINLLSRPTKKQFGYE